SWRPVFGELLGLGIELHKQAARAAEPGIAIGIEAAALGRCARRARLQFDRLALLDVQKGDPVLRPRAAGEIFAVGGDLVAIGGGHGLEQAFLYVLGRVALDLVDRFAARIPDVAVWREREIAKTRGVDRAPEMRELDVL